jgi:heme A synthase
MSTHTEAATARRTDRPTSRLYSSVIGLSALAVLLQGLWAGLFVQEGQDYKDSWVRVHALGGEVAIALALVATVIAFVKLRSRRDVVVASVVFTVLLVLEAYLGGLIGDHATLTAVHFPLAMALMGLAVWLPLRAARR